MSETLLIHYNITTPKQATWALSNDAGEITSKITTGSLEELAEQCGTHPIVILLNSQCLHINQLKLPTQNMQKMLKAIPFALEEFIAEDIEKFHFVIAKNKNDNSTSVVGIDKDDLHNIIEVFQQAGISIEKIIPDALCLAGDAETRQWACLNFQDESWLQTDTLNGMAISHSLLPYVLNSKLHDKKLQAPGKILFFSESEDTGSFDDVAIDINNDKSGGLAGDHADNDSDEDENIEIIKLVYNTHPLVVFCGHYRQAMPLNLLQNEFKIKRKSSGLWQHWRLAASLAAIWLVLHLGLTGYQYSTLAAENQVTKARIIRVYKQAFPKSKKIINPRAQMEQKLNELKGNAGGDGNGLIYLLAESFGSLGEDKSNITLNSLSFRNNRMDISLDGNNLQTIETLNQKLNKNTNIKSEITSSSSEKDKVKGNLRIEGRG
jgi:general secretion pathway protein L